MQCGLKSTKTNLYIPIDILGLNPTNPFTHELIQALDRQGLDIDYGLFRLAHSKNKWHIVNFQWPEEIFGWSEPSPNQLLWLENRLIEISKISRVVITIHNSAPHYRDTDGFAALYRLVYKYTDAFVHLGQASVDILHARYPNECTNKIHRVIPHGNYNAFGKFVSKNIAHSQLHLPENRQLVLVVGALRNEEEYVLLADSLPLWIDEDSGLLLAATVGFKPKLRLRTLHKRLRFEVLMRLQMRWLSRNRNVFIKPGPIPHDQMAALVCAADVVLIPRLRGLNSGNVPLGFTYGKVVVGPDVGVVGQILKDTGNPVFKPEDGANGVAEAVKAGLRLAAAGHGKSNKQIAQTDWDWDNVARQYRQLYAQLLAKRMLNTD